jgi:hypothetical protein
MPRDERPWAMCGAAGPTFTDAGAVLYMTHNKKNFAITGIGFVPDTDVRISFPKKEYSNPSRQVITL